MREIASDPNQLHSLDFYALSNLQLTFQLFEAHWRRVDPGWSFPLHHHGIFEINIVTAGTQRIKIGSRVVYQQPGDVVLIRPGEKHTSAVEGAERMELLAVHFDVDDAMIRQLLLQSKDVLHPVGSELERALRPVKERMQRLVVQRDDSEPSARLQTTTWTFELFFAIGSWLSEQQNSSNRVGQGIAERIADEVEKMAETDWQNEDLFERDGITQIAEKLGYSPAYCNRVFRSAFGMPPRRYLSTLKLRKAKMLLLDRDLTIEQIAETLGYRDTAHFSKQFKRWMAVSPSAYRQTL